MSVCSWSAKLLIFHLITYCNLPASCLTHHRFITSHVPAHKKILCNKAKSTKKTQEKRKINVILYILTGYIAA